MVSPFYAQRRNLYWGIGCLGALLLALLLALILFLTTGLISVGPRPGPQPPSGNPTAVATSGPGTQPTAGPGGAAPATPGPGGSTPGSAGARNLGLVGVDLANPPASAGPSETLVIHGDVDHSGRCSVRVFGPGQRVVATLGGIFRVVSLPGTPEQNGDRIRAIQSAAAADARQDCPLR